jgi:hypothetical protein
MIMKYQNAIMSIVMVALASATLTGMVMSDQYAHVAHAEVVGFDALAHDLFASAGDSGKQAE